MSFEDRGYARSGGGGGYGGGSNPFWRVLEFLNLRIPIGTYFGIQVAVHISFVIIPLLFLSWYGNFFFALEATAVLFMSVLLHEFGHCFGCRWVGGQANYVLMWPLGGLAYCAPPRRPWPEFVTVACGPLVNVIIATGCFIALALWFGAETPVSLNPLRMLVGFGDDSPGSRLLIHLFLVNYTLLLFNLLLVFYPFDGGRLVQIALWSKLGYARSMQISLMVGMFGAIGVSIFGLIWMQSLFVMLIGVFGFMTCYRTRQSMGAYAYSDEPAYSTSTPRKGWLERRRENVRARTLLREIERKQKLEQEVNRILDKVHAGGLGSLTEKEKRTLQQGTQESKKTRV